MLGAKVSEQLCTSRLSSAYLGSAAAALVMATGKIDTTMSESVVVRSFMPYFCIAMPPVNAQVAPFALQNLAR